MLQEFGYVGCSQRMMEGMALTGVHPDMVERWRLSLGTASKASKMGSDGNFVIVGSVNGLQDNIKYLL